MNKFRNWFYRVMQGRYGGDELSRFISIIILILIVVFMFVRFPFENLIILALLIYLYFRIFSKNISKRYAENQKFLQFRDKILRRSHASGQSRAERKMYHIYKCPGCGQKIRIPRGKGRIMVRCPKCGSEFEKRS